LSRRPPQATHVGRRRKQRSSHDPGHGKFWGGGEGWSILVAGNQLNPTITTRGAHAAAGAEPSRPWWTERSPTSVSSPRAQRRPRTTPRPRLRHRFRPERRATQRRQRRRPRSADCWQGHRGRAFSCTYEGDAPPPGSPVYEHGGASWASFQPIHHQHRTLRPHPPAAPVGPKHLRPFFTTTSAAQLPARYRSTPVPRTPLPGACGRDSAGTCGPHRRYAQTAASPST